jgi:IPTL-CTERM motif
MKSRTWIAALLATATALFAGGAGAQLLFTATGSNGVNGNLFIINPATAAATLVGPILVGATPVSLTGLAVQPGTGVLYGSIANGSPNLANNLITINTATGAATVVGPFGIAQGTPDLAFNAAGTLFGWNRTTNSLVTINLATGAATNVAASGLAAFNTGGGVAVSGTTAIVAIHSSAGTLDSVNTTTGVGTTGPTLAGAPIGGSINSMSFSPTGVLFGVNSNNSGSPTTNFLVTINSATGAVTSIGALPGDTDAIAFSPQAAPNGVVPTMSEWALITLALLLAGAGALAIRRRGA